MGLWYADGGAWHHVAGVLVEGGREKAIFLQRFVEVREVPLDPVHLPPPAVSHPTLFLHTHPECRLFPSHPRRSSLFRILLFQLALVRHLSSSCPLHGSDCSLFLAVHVVIARERAIN